MESTTPLPLPAQTAKIPSTIAYYYAFIVLGLITGIFGPTLPTLARQTQSTLGAISIIFAGRSLGYLLGSFLSGRLFDRIRGHPLLVVALILAAFALASTPLVHTLMLLGVIVFVLGIAESGIDVGGNSLLLWIHGERVGPFMNGLHFFFGVGALLSPIIVAQVVLSTGEIVWAYWLLAIVALPAALSLLRLPSPQPRNHSQQHFNVRASWLIVAATVLFFFLYVGAEVGYGNWIYTYATKLNLSDATGAALLTSAFWGAFTFGRLIGVPLSARLKPVTILFVDLVGAMACLIAVMLLSQSVTALWLGTLGIGLFIASIFPTTLALAGQKMTVTGEITGLFLFGAGGGGMFLPWVIGQFIEPIGATIMLVLVFVCLFAEFALLILVLGRNNRDGSAVRQSVA